MRIGRLSRLSLCLPLVVALGGSTGIASGIDIPTLAAAGVSRQPPAGDAPVDAVVAAVTALGADMAADADPGVNWVASPLSVLYAFAMARAGAAGETAAELDRALRLPATGLHDAVDALARGVATTDLPAPAGGRPDDPQPTRPPVVCLANGVFPQAGLPVGAGFLAMLARHYGAGVHPVDFRGDGAERVINEWVRQRTAGRIDRLFQRLPGDTALVLANTLYLRADWQHPFGEIGTADARFTRADGSHIDVSMMRQFAELRYAVRGGWQAVELPYAHSDLAMLVLVPPPGVAAWAGLAPPTLAATMADLRDGYLDVSLPRWDFASFHDLVPTLRRLGVERAFGPGADFSGISAGMSIDQAVQRATVTVDELGTEAAAVTGIAMRVSAQVPPRTTIRADRPFAFAVVRRHLGLPLFVGTVQDPTVQTAR